MKLVCPNCAVEIPPSHTNLVEGIYSCPMCQEFFRISASLVGEVAAMRAPKPNGTSVELICEEDTLGLILPSGRSRGTAVFFVGFAIFWNAVTWSAVISAVAQHDQGVSRFIFLLPFMAVALGLLGIAAFSLFGEFTLMLDRRECRAIWSLFKWNRSKVVSTVEITAVGEHVAYTKNNRPVHGIAIHHGNRTLTFGSGLTDPERMWVIGEIRHYLKGGAKPALVTCR